MRDFFTGVRLFGRGLGILLRSPRLLLIGMLPAALTTVLLAGGMIALVYWIGDLTALITPFADEWAEVWRIAMRVAAGVALVGVALVLGLTGFTALALAIGGPFYEHIAEKVEDDLGGPPSEEDLSWWWLLWVGLRDGVVLMLRSLLFTLPLSVAGFIPVVGQTVVPVLMALVTAWFFALELVAVCPRPCCARFRYWPSSSCRSLSSAVCSSLPRSSAVPTPLPWAPSFGRNCEALLAPVASCPSRAKHRCLTGRVS